MSFVIANDKKIKLIKLRKELVEDMRGSGDGEAAQLEADRCRDPPDSSFVERFLQSNGQIIFPKTEAHTQLI